jgi:hypothetical protein
VSLGTHQRACEPGRNGRGPGSMFFAAYVGPSMNPTLREPEIIEILPYGGRPLRVGDVVFFLPPEADQPVVHRIIRVTPAGISTLGDSNTREDTLIVQPEDIQGQVVAVWHGQKRRAIAGGVQGHLTSRWLRWRRLPGKRVSRLLHAPYYALSRHGVIARLMPAPFRPRVVVFQTEGHGEFRLLLGQQIIGRYDARKHLWKIRRPFRLIVDARVLQAVRDENRTGRCRVIAGSGP